MLSGVLHSDRAIRANIQIMRTYTRLRRLLASHQNVLKRLEAHDALLSTHDQKIIKIFEVLRSLLNLPLTLKRKTRKIGFIQPEKE